MERLRPLGDLWVALGTWWGERRRGRDGVPSTAGCAACTPNYCPINCCSPNCYPLIAAPPNCCPLNCSCAASPRPDSVPFGVPPPPGARRVPSPVTFVPWVPPRPAPSSPAAVSRWGEAGTEAPPLPLSLRSWRGEAGPHVRSTGQGRAGAARFRGRQQFWGTAKPGSERGGGEHPEGTRWARGARAHPGVGVSNGGVPKSCPLPKKGTGGHRRKSGSGDGDCVVRAPPLRGCRAARSPSPHPRPQPSYFLPKTPLQKPPFCQQGGPHGGCLQRGAVGAGLGPVSSAGRRARGVG